MGKSRPLWHFFYKVLKHKDPPERYADYSLGKLLFKPIRKWITNVVAPNCVFNNIRIWLYRRCGFKIGKHVFIGMHCYLDDMCYDLMKIGNDVTISYGVYFACHGKHQNHYPITISDGAYVGMRANVISKNAVGGGTDHGVIIGKNAIVGACTLVNRDVPDDATAVGIPCRIIESTINKGD